MHMGIKRDMTLTIPAMSFSYTESVLGIKGVMALVYGWLGCCLLDYLEVYLQWLFISNSHSGRSFFPGN